MFSFSSSSIQLIVLWLPAAVALAAPPVKPTEEPPNFNRYDFVPLIIEGVFLVGFFVAMAVVEYLIRAGVLAKEEARGPTKIHLEHLKEYEEQETKFLEAGGQANPIRTPRTAIAQTPLVAVGDEQSPGQEPIAVAA